MVDVILRGLQILNSNQSYTLAVSRSCRRFSLNRRSKILRVLDVGAGGGGSIAITCLQSKDCFWQLMGSRVRSRVTKKVFLSPTPDNHQLAAII